MKWVKLEQSNVSYWADYVVFSLAVVALAVFAGWQSPPAMWLAVVSIAGLGWIFWSLVEYLMHRFVLHAVQPFKRWHTEHHQRPVALIATPTWISAVLIAAIVLVPLALITSPWAASAFTSGLLCGYLFYAATHHATHHWRASNRWSKYRKRIHARHHHSAEPRDFGVTSQIWDRVFGTTSPPMRADE